VNGLEFVRVPAGEFLYGEKKERIWLEEFWIMKCPVTVSEYRRFCEATNRKMPKHPVWGWIDDHPMVNVSWHDANAFAKWEGCRLPMEREWEKAARGTDGREYPWGNIFDAAKCVCSVVKKRSSTAPVGSCPAGASPYECMDMAGNVWEWCQNFYDQNHNWRVLRGGSWYYDRTKYFTTTFRNWYDPSDNHNAAAGIRVVMISTD
jgi:serine/threonine-protein kinase